MSSLAARSSLTSLPSRPSPYAFGPNELHPGPRNRLFLSLRSTIPSQVDWALPRLVVASYEKRDQFKLETWVDSVGTLLYWPEKWITELEERSTLDLLKKVDSTGVEKRDSVDVLDDSDNDSVIWMKRRKLANKLKGLIPEWTTDPAIERRAMESLLVLRNASFIGTNAKLTCRATTISLLQRFFSLPLAFLVDTTVRYPEATNHILTILIAILPHLLRSITTGLLRVFSTTLPNILVETRDSAMLNLILPILIHTASIPILPPLPPTLIPHLLHLLTVRPTTLLLDLVLDLLVTLSSNPAHAGFILSLPSFSAHLRTIVPLLSSGSTPFSASWAVNSQVAGKSIPNPAGGAIQAEKASRQRQAEREKSQRLMEVFGGPGVFCEVGDVQPSLSESTKKRLYSLKEPRRSIAWMHETFVYCSSSQLLQVKFWHSYRDFFQYEATAEQLLSASEVIKNVTIAFPGANAKVWRDEMGNQKFVIAGMGFRKSQDGEERFSCLWRDCPTTNERFSDTAQLLAHVQSTHLTPTPVQCHWGICRHTPFTLSHLLTHLPLVKQPPIPEMITVHPGLSETSLNQPRITSRPIAPLPISFKLSFSGQKTALDDNRHPTGTAFLVALLIRNLSRALRNEIASSDTAPGEMEQGQKEEKKKHLLEERFGLPIPESVLREEEEEEKEARGGREVDEGMNGQERERARMAFMVVETRVLEVMEKNMGGLGQYLGEAVGW